MNKLKELARGKAKTLFETDDPELLVMEYRDDTSAFDGGKTASLDRKGRVNNRINAFIMERLESAGIATHFVRLLGDRESIVRRLEMIPVECVIRNIAAGSLCKRLGVEEGLEFSPPIFEFFLKNDELHDPMITDEHIRAFGWAEPDEVAEMKQLTARINEVLAGLFADAGMLLVDYKVEFGRCGGRLLMGDEFTPDGCRLWDAETRRKMDKDRFRRDLGDVVETYEEVAARLGVDLS